MAPPPPSTSTHSTPPLPGGPGRRSPQFSLRTLLVVVTVVAVASAIFRLTGVAAWVVLLLVAGVIPVAVGTLALFCRGYRQTFFAAGLAGLAPVVVIILDAAIDSYWNATEFLTLAGLEVVGILACGFTATTARRLVERRGWDRPAAGEKRPGEEP